MRAEAQSSFRIAASKRSRPTRTNDNTITCQGCTFVYNGEVVDRDNAPINLYANLTGNKLIIDGVDVLA